MTKPANLILAHGSHSPGDTDDCGNPERCFWEWYNWLDREKHTNERPAGVSPVLHVFSVRLNDLLPDAKRQELAAWLPNGTSPLAGTDDGRDERRGYLALDWLIRSYTPPWLDLAGLTGEAASLRGLAEIRDMATASAAGLVVRAARDKAAAAWAAAGDAAGDAVWAAVWAAAWAAAGDAAWDAAGDKLAPVVAELQSSAVELFGRMIGARDE